jgi:signal transduction histidine kinase
MTNGIQAMEPGGGELHISLEEHFIEDKAYVMVNIRDTGPGIEKDIIERIFEPFFTTKDIDKGTGMGLSVAHGIISRMDGEINVVSKPGKGSSFAVIIPVNSPSGCE